MSAECPIGFGDCYKCKWCKADEDGDYCSYEEEPEKEPEPMFDWHELD